ncbi:hypothetical protein ACFE04_007834 [Oxalis oulophora]
MTSFANVKRDEDYIQQQLQSNNVEKEKLAMLDNLLTDVISNGEKCKTELQALTEQYHTLKLQYDLDKSYKIKAENQVVNLKRDLEEKISENERLKNENARLIAQKNEWSLRVVNAEKREKRNLENFLEEKKRCAELQIEKDDVVEELSMRNRNFIELEKRVSRLEEDALYLKKRTTLKDEGDLPLPAKGNGSALIISPDVFTPAVRLQPQAPDVVILDSDDESPPKRKEASELSGTESHKRTYFTFMKNLKTENVDSADGMDVNSPNSRFKLAKLHTFTPQSVFSPNSSSNAANASPFTKLSENKVREERSSDGDNSSGFPVSEEINKLMHQSKNNKVWGSIEDMRNALKEDDELPLIGICALYRQNVFLKDSISMSYPDIIRGNELGSLLTEDNQQGKLIRCSKDLVKHDPKALVDCRQLTMALLPQLFEIYKKEGDSVFHGR